MTRRSSFPSMVAAAVLALGLAVTTSPGSAQNGGAAPAARGTWLDQYVSPGRDGRVKNAYRGANGADPRSGPGSCPQSGCTFDNGMNPDFCIECTWPEGSPNYHGGNGS
jgi:hypothetical protein